MKQTRRQRVWHKVALLLSGASVLSVGALLNTTDTSAASADASTSGDDTSSHISNADQCELPTQNEQDEDAVFFVGCGGAS